MGYVVATSTAIETPSSASQNAKPFQARLEGFKGAVDAPTLTVLAQDFSS
jgi:hypothetical protein